MSDDRPRGRRAFMLGRRVRPLAFWVGYANVVLIVGITMGMIVGTTLDTGIGRILAVPAAAAVVLLVGGFWFDIVRWMLSGLLLSTFLWLAVAMAALPDTWHSSISGWLAIGWAGLTSWAWWIEAEEPTGQ